MNICELSPQNAPYDSQHLQPLTTIHTEKTITVTNTYPPNSARTTLARLLQIQKIRCAKNELNINHKRS